MCNHRESTMEEPTTPFPDPCHRLVIEFADAQSVSIWSRVCRHAREVTDGDDVWLDWQLALPWQQRKPRFPQHSD